MFNNSYHQPNTIKTINDLGVLYREQSKYNKAENLLSEAHKKHTTLGEDFLHALTFVQELAVLYGKSNAYDKAEPLLLKAVEGQRLKHGDTHSRTQESLKNLIELYEARDKPEKAEDQRAKLPQTELVN